MTIGERIKKIRKEKKISVDYLAAELGISKTTLYRYEDSTIEKIPIKVFDRLCILLDVSPAELMGNIPAEQDQPKLPSEFKDARQAIEFLIKSPLLAAYGGYDPASMSDETIVKFANEILHQLEIVSHKYKNITTEITHEII